MKATVYCLRYRPGRARPWEDFRDDDGLYSAEHFGDAVKRAQAFLANDYTTGYEVQVQARITICEVEP